MTLLILPSQVSAATLARQLDIGMSGSDVSALQQFYALDSAIYPEGLVTGYYGALTAAATERFQLKNGLDVVGRVGPLTLSALNTQMGGTGNTSPNIGGTGSGDNSAPILQPETVRVSANAATFTWMTNEPANARVLYGNSWPFLLSAAPSFSATGGLSTFQSVTISGLTPNTKYSYVLESTDANGNMNMTLGKSFVTATSTSM
jgi:peptidoglycan hydrolase-like protein with peptidoglycan-binding domain